MQSLCYGCLAEDTKWRGPKHGWLCLRCFSETTQPAVQIADEAHRSTDAAASSHALPLVSRTDQAGATGAWVLQIFHHASEKPAERYSLGTNLDPEQAVDEAKWVLSKKNWSDE
jgi:hypothetical protein